MLQSIGKSMKGVLGGVDLEFESLSKTAADVKAFALVTRCAAPAVRPLANTSQMLASAFAVALRPLAQHNND